MSSQYDILQRQVNVLRDQVKLLMTIQSITYDDLEKLELDCSRYGHIWGETQGSLCALYRKCEFCDEVDT